MSVAKQLEEHLTSAIWQSEGLSTKQSDCSIADRLGENKSCRLLITMNINTWDTIFYHSSEPSCASCWLEFHQRTVLLKQKQSIGFPVQMCPTTAWGCVAVSRAYSWDCVFVSLEKSLGILSLVSRQGPFPKDPGLFLSCHHINGNTDLGVFSHSPFITPNQKGLLELPKFNATLGIQKEIMPSPYPHEV